MTPQSAKQKGANFQKKVAAKLIDLHPELSPDDVRSCSMGSNGSDILLSQAAKTALPFEFECKKHKTGFTKCYDALTQATGHGELTPVVFAEQDRRKPIAIMYMSDFEKLLSYAKAQGIDLTKALK